MTGKSDAHIIRAAIITGIGMLVTVVAAVIIGIIVGPAVRMVPSSMAERVDGERTRLFVRAMTMESILTAARWWGTSIPIDGTISDARALEFAVEASSDSLAWQMETRQTWDESDAHIHVRSEYGTGGGPPVTNVREGSLAENSFFRLHAPRLSESGTSFLYAKLGNIPADLTSQAPLLRSMLHSFSDAILTWNVNPLSAATHGALWLKPRHLLRNTGQAFPDLRSLRGESGTILSISLDRPSELLGTLGRTVQEEDPAFAEGCLGVLESLLEHFTGRTTLDGARRDLLSGPAQLAVKRNGEGTATFLFCGHALSTEAADGWMTALTSKASPAIVRSLQLGTNRRTDVIALETPPPLLQPNGWSMRTIGSGSTVPLALGMKGAAYCLSNDGGWLVRSLRSPRRQGMSDGSNAGIVDLAPAREAIGKVFPFASELLINPLLAPEREGVLRWVVRGGGGSVEIRWEMTTDQTPMTNE